MALYRSTRIYEGAPIHTDIIRKPRGTPLRYGVTSSTGVVTYNTRLTAIEAHKYRSERLSYGINSFTMIFSVVLILLVFSNINFSASPTFGELSLSTGLSFDTLCQELNDTADVNLVDRVDELFDSLNFVGDNAPTPDNDILAVLQDILNGIFTLVRGVVFVVDLVISMLQVLWSFVKIVLIFFSGA